MNKSKLYGYQIQHSNHCWIINDIIIDILDTDPDEPITIVNDDDYYFTSEFSNILNVKLEWDY
jgi:hypothetical protein